MAEFDTAAPKQRIGQRRQEFEVAFTADERIQPIIHQQAQRKPEAALFTPSA